MEILEKKSYILLILDSLRVMDLGFFRDNPNKFSCHPREEKNSKNFLNVTSLPYYEM